MTLLLLGWSLLTVLRWTSGSDLVLSQQNLTVLYPKINSSEIIECDCLDFSCDAVFWFRISSSNLMEFIGKCNNADRVNWGKVDSSKYKSFKRGASFVLRIIRVTEADQGIYSCVLKDTKNEVWKRGTLLLPGVTPPTQPPKTKPKPSDRSSCRCKGSNSPKDGCDSLILWPLVGLVAGLGLTLLCILYYFSRLPKKCRHQFMKKRQMT
ncbi:uncharacterized protein cd8b [Parambassis ranga]|uniref:Uncharacterized protein cd8b n=1 Tax=Parambassis ranga TaxID=210632 RepID=A0A6P7I9J2_9TELE|nr:uncharacterized protein LOC114435661 [Parambassis ranga]